MRVLLVEDDVRLGDALVEALTDELYTVDLVRNGEEGWEQVQIIDYDLVLLDVTLPRLDGVGLCRRLRSHGYNLPVLMITARDTSDDKVRGLDAGADDYVVKPIDLPELLARMRALLRRGSSAPPVLQWGDLRLDPSTCEVCYGENFLQLTRKEYSLLQLLMRNGRRVLSRTSILHNLWDLADPPTEETVKAHIKGLRYKLRAAGAPRDFIETVYSIGYRLNAMS